MARTSKPEKEPIKVPSSLCTFMRESILTLSVLEEQTNADDRGIENQKIMARIDSQMAAGSYKEGTKAFLASNIPQLVEDMENGMSADEAVPHYTRPMDVVEMLSEFMGSGRDMDDE